MSISGPCASIGSLKADIAACLLSANTYEDGNARYFAWHCDVLPACFMIALPPARIAKL
jgi:hypothetical protein